ncbi:hypothetical protein ACLK1S_01550 [Escherichia coli]
MCSRLLMEKPSLTGIDVINRLMWIWRGIDLMQTDTSRHVL